MADKKATQETKTLEREYIIPLRKEWRKVANYRRTGRAVKAIKQFIARHMKVPDRDVSKVKLDMYLNQEVWFRGKKKPPAKIKVKAIKEGDIVRVELAELPEHWKFVELKRLKLHKPDEKEKEKSKEKPAEAAAKPEDKKEGDKKEGKKEETPEEKEKEEKQKESSEKAQASAEQKTAYAEQTAKEQRKATKIKTPKIQRKALKK